MSTSVRRFQMPERDAPPPLPTLPTTWRPTRTVVVIYTVAVLVLVTMVTIAILLPYDGGRPWNVRDRVLFALIGVIAAGFLHVLARCRVVADERGITVVNMLRTRRLDWAQVVRVNLRPGDPWVYLDLDDGETLPVMGIQSSGGMSAREAAAQLRALVDVHSFTERDD